ncbi:MAG: protoporphyrinogen oxidase HemJ [Alphaproteobacteria bacterium]
MILKSLHVIAVISWMAGLLYLPRLFVYHAAAEKDSELDKTLQIMEFRLLKIIMNPAMMATWVLGIALIAASPEFLKQGWLHLKLTLIIFLTVFHVFLGRWRRLFAEGKNVLDGRFFRRVNEIPTIIMILVVLLVIVKPF